MEIVYYVATSLDGFIAAPDGSVAWLQPFEGGGEDYGYAEFYASVDALILGSRTYEQALTFGEWPYAGKPCRVLTRRRRASAGPDVVLTDADPRSTAADLTSSGFRKAWLVGGGALAGSFRRDGLITGYVVSVIPVVLGAGIPLFVAGGPLENLRLVASRAYPSGVVQLTYARAG